MDKEIKKEARKQYFHYFRFWFIGIGILLAFVLAGTLLNGMVKESRGNTQAPEKRVYDYADVLSDAEEIQLEEYISSCENRSHIDLVLVTVSEDMEALDYSWENAMMNYADDFYDDNLFGYNKVHGDGALLLDNWYEGQEGSWLSTCGSVYHKFSNYDIDRVLDKVYFRIDTSPYEAYKAYVDETCRLMDAYSAGVSIPWLAIVFLPIIVAVVFALSHLKQKKAEDTTKANTYVQDGKARVNVKSDNFIRKNVVTRRIETSSSSGGGHRGGGGGHVSRSGVSHGGGGRRR